jgi:fibronectin-binding autotransporter adhesin
MVPTTSYTRSFSIRRLLPAFLCLGSSLAGLYGQSANGLEQKAIRRLMSSGPVLVRPFWTTPASQVRPFATVDNWLGGPGNWNNAALWSAGVPTAGSDVFISDHVPASVVTLNVSGNANNLTIGATSSLNFNNNTSLTIGGSTITNSNNTGSGGITLNSGGNPTDLIAGSPSVTLTGGGIVTLSNNAANRIYGAVAANVLTNANNTIQGSGNIGAGQMALVNQGTINANQPTALTIQTSNGTTNTGTLEATAGGKLILLGGTYTNTGGTILASGANSVVTLQNPTINGGTLNTAGGGLIQASGNPTLNGVTNTGTYQLPNNQSTTILGAITNNGNIQVNSGGNNTVLYVSGPASLTGGGAVTLSDNNANYITQLAPGDSLTNVNNTISGSGNIGNNVMAFTNLQAGVVNATSSTGHVLTLQTGAAGATNLGLMEASAGGTLQLLNTVVNTNGTINGTIEALDGGTVLLNGATVAGGTLTTAGTGVVQGISGATLDGSGNPITNAGNLQVPNNNTVNVKGAVNNTGTLALNSAGNSTVLMVNSPTATLQGSGTVTLSDNNGNYIASAVAGNQLINTQTIQGPGGNIGNNSLVILNQGTIDATASAYGQTLTVQPYLTLTNTGLLEATGGGSLALYGGTFANTGGTITAGSGSTVTLRGGATVAGGTLNGAGNFVAEAGSQLDGSGGALTSAGNLHIPNNNYLYIQGTLNNTGTLFLDSGGNNTQLLVNSPIATLQGAGTVTLSDNNANYIQAAAAGNQLINKQTIQGPGGNIGNGNLAILNQGTIDATASAFGQTLALQPGATLTNTGLLEATGGGTLALRGGTFSNAGGVITAGSGSNVRLEAPTVVGGTLNGAGTFTSFTGTTLDGVTNAGVIQVPNNNGTTLTGTINNTGSLRLNSGGNNTLFLASGPVTLTGGGTLTLSDNNANYMYNPGGGSLTNVNNTISGSGNIGNGSMAFTNQPGGVVNATSAAGQSLTIDSGAAGAVNAGVLQSSSGGTLVLNNAIDNTGGAIRALAGTGSNAGGSVVINGAAITGGTLNTLGTGINVGSMIAQNSAILNGVTNDGTIRIPNNTAAQLAGTVTNNGSIQVNSGGNNTFLRINGNTTLNGKGTISLSNNAANYMDGAAGTEVLTNNGNTIQGSGTLGNGSLGLVNNGTVLANQSTPLYIRPNSSGFTNNGTVAVNAGSLLNITAGPFTNFNSATGTLTGGTYNVTGTLQFDNANILTNAANITLTGAGSQIGSHTSANALANFAVNAAGGRFTLGAGRNFTTGGNFTNNGTLTVAAGDTFKVSGNLANFAGSALTGGTYNIAGTLQFGAPGSSLSTNAAALTLSGTGAKLLDLAGNNLLSLFNTNAAGGSFMLYGGGSFTTSGAFTNAGSIDLEKAGLLTVSGNLTNSGTVATNNLNLLGGANRLSVTGTLTNNSGANVIIGANNNTSDRAGVGVLANAGTVTVGAGAVLNLTKAAANSNTGTIALGGTLNLWARSALSGNGTVNLTNGLIAGVGSALTFSSGNTIAGSGTISNLGITNNGVLFANQAAPLLILPTAAGLNNKGTLAVNAGSTMQIGTSAGGALVNFAGNTLTGGIYSIAGTLQFGAPGTTLITNAARLTLTGTGARLIDFAGNDILAGFKTNAATGNFRLASGASLTTTGGDFINAGLFTIAKNSIFTVGGSSFNFTQTSGTTTVDGYLASAGAGTLHLNGGSLFGTGSLFYSVVDAATLSPGDTTTTPGVLTVTRTYAQSAAGALDISIGGAAPGTGYDRLSVTKGATLSGTLNVHLINGFVPAIGSTFDILNASSVSGVFSTVNGLAINGSEHFEVSYDGNHVSLIVVAGPAAPGTGITVTQFDRVRRGSAVVTAAVARPASASRFATARSVSVAGRTNVSQRASVPPLNRALGRRGFRPMDSAPAAAVLTAPQNVSALAPAAAPARTNFAFRNPMRFECGVNVNTLLKTSPKRLLKGLFAAPDSPDAVTVGYMSYTASHQPR